MSVVSRPVAAHTPMAFVQAVLQAYAERGRDPSGALLKAQITPTNLANPDLRVGASAFERLCAAAMQELDDEALGWFSRRLPWGSYGLLARASTGAPTLGVALARWCRHHGLLTDDVRLTLAVARGVATLSIEERRLPPALREFALLSLLRNAHGLACWWIDSRIPLAEAVFPFAAPAHADAYARMFPGPARFGAARAALRFDAGYLQLPLRRDDAALDLMLRRALALMVLPYRHDRLLVERVRQLLASGGAHTAESVAAQLAVSARTLHRALRAEGASLQVLKDEARRARATELLLRTRRPVKQVAHEAGFRSDKAFIRAFRAWTGHTPDELRRQAE